MSNVATNDNTPFPDELIVPVRNLHAALGAYAVWQRSQTNEYRLNVAAEDADPFLRAFERARVAWDANPTVTNTARLLSVTIRYYEKLCRVVGVPKMDAAPRPKRRRIAAPVLRGPWIKTPTEESNP